MSFCPSRLDLEFEITTSYRKTGNRHVATARTCRMPQLGVGHPSVIVCCSPDPWSARGFFDGHQPYTHDDEPVVNIHAVDNPYNSDEHQAAHIGHANVLQPFPCLEKKQAVQLERFS